MEKVDWITTWYEFGGEMQISSARLQALPLFRNGIPLELYIHHSSEAKKRRVDIVMLPYVQSATEFYNLINRHRYGTRPLDENSNMRKFYESMSLPDDFRPGCLNIQLEGEKSSLHMSRHLMESLEYIRGKSSFQSGLEQIEFMTGVRRETLELLLFDDDRELDDAESFEYYEAFEFYKSMKPTLTIYEKNELRVGKMCHPLDQRTEPRETSIRNLITKLLKMNDVDVPFEEASSIDAKCRCLLGSYSLSTHRPRHTVKVNVYSIDSDGQKDSINKVYAHDYMNNQKAGSKLEVIVDGNIKKNMLLTPIVKCEDDINHIDFVKTIAKREMSKLLPANFISEFQTTGE